MRGTKNSTVGFNFVQFYNLAILSDIVPGTGTLGSAPPPLVEPFPLWNTTNGTFLHQLGGVNVVPLIKQVVVFQGKEGACSILTPKNLY